MTKGRPFFGVLFSTLALQIPVARAADSAEFSRAGGLLAVKAGADWLQVSKACCSEYDRWSAVGPQLGAQLGWGGGQYVRISSDVLYAFLPASDTAYHKDLVIHRFDARLVVDGIFPGSKGEAFRAGLGAGIDILSAHGREPITFDTSRRVELTEAYVQILGRVGIELFVRPGFALGLDVDGEISFLNLTSQYSVAVPAGGALLLVGSWI